MTTLTFHNTELNVISQNNQIWLTSAELAKALDYSDARSVTKIFNRNQDEFSQCMTEVVKLTTNGISNTSRQKSVRIFSLRGAHLIAMFARTPIAKDFRKWVLDILDKEVANNVVISKLDQPLLRTVEINQYNLECFIEYAKKAKAVLDNSGICTLLDKLGNNTVTQAYNYLDHGLMHAACLNVGARNIEIKI